MGGTMNQSVKTIAQAYAASYRANKHSLTLDAQTSVVLRH